MSDYSLPDYDALLIQFYEHENPAIAQSGSSDDEEYAEYPNSLTFEMEEECGCFCQEFNFFETWVFHRNLDCILCHETEVYELTNIHDLCQCFNCSTSDDENKMALSNV